MLETESLSTLERFLPKMGTYEQRQYLNAVLSFLTKRYFGSILEEKEYAPLASSPTVSGAACVIHNLIKGNELLKERVVSLLTTSTIPSLDDSLAIRRSTLAAIAK